VLANSSLAPPQAAQEIFGPALPVALAYARLLAGPGIERGLLGPSESADLRTED